MKRNVVVLLLCIVICGCAQPNKYAPQTTPVNYYPSCYEPIKAVKTGDNNVGRDTALGAIAGGFVGGLVGFFTTGKVKDAAVMAAGGVIVGGALGYAKAKQDAIQSAHTRYASYIDDIDGEISSLDRVTLAGRTSFACYEQSYTTLTSQYQNREISPEEYQARYNEIHAGLGETAELLGQAHEGSRKVNEQFQAALNDEAQKAGKPVPVVRKKADKTSSKKISTLTQPAVPAKRPYLEGLDANSLEAMAAGADEYKTANQALAVQQAAVRTQMQTMETYNANIALDSI